MRGASTPFRSFAARVCALLFMTLGLGACMRYDLEANAAAACSAYAQSTCLALNRCSAQLVTEVYGSLDQCEQTLSSQCVSALVLPDVLGTPEGARTCAARMAAVSCSDLFNRTLPAECQPPSGLRADGATCWASAQCASARCSAQANDTAPGTCEELSKASERCQAPDDCGAGLLCSSGVCKAPSQLGAACDAASPCRSPLVCTAGVCAAAKTDANNCNGATSCAALSPATRPDVACSSFAQAVCARLDGCSSRLIEAVYGDAQTCISQTAANCMRTLLARDSSGTPIGVAGCAAAMQTLDCAALLDHASPDACQLAKGPRPDGAKCTVDSQCASTRCNIAAASACGACTPLAQREEVCGTDTDCARTLVCAQDGHCRAPATTNAACDTTHRCAYPLTCDTGRCIDALAQGAACLPAADRCNHYAGLACDAGSHCAPWAAAKPGQSCRDAILGELACTAGSTCGEGATALCAGPLSEASACSATTGPKCHAPALCLAGHCTVPSDEVCR